MVEKTFINPATGKLFAWHEYNAHDDTVLAYGIGEDREEELRAMLSGLNVKLYFTDELTDIYGIPYFFAIINPTEIVQDEFAGFFEFWSYDPDLKILFTEPLPPNLSAPKVKYKVEAESLSDLAKLRLDVIKPDQDSGEQTAYSGKVQQSCPTDIGYSQGIEIQSFCNNRLFGN